MKMLPVLSIYDVLLGYKSCFVEQNIAVAKRGFANSLKRVLDGGDYSEINPTDLSLYHIGYFDCDNGTLESMEPDLVVSGTAVVTEYHISKSDNPNHSNFKEVENDL